MKTQMIQRGDWIDWNGIITWVVAAHDEGVEIPGISALIPYEDIWFICTAIHGAQDHGMRTVYDYL